MRIALAILIAASVSSCGRSELAPIFGDARACTVFQLPPVSRADASCASLSFTTPQTFSGPAVGNEMFTIRDINGDGYPDIIGTSDHTEIFFNKGDGTFDPPVQTPTFSSAGWYLIGDFNGDCVPDLATISGGGWQFADGSIDAGYWEPEALHVMFNRGNGTFAPEVTSSLGTRNLGNELPLVGDFNHDGLADLASIYNDDSLLVYLNRGEATFGAPATYAIANFDNQLVMGDVNADGAIDIVIAHDSSVGIVLNHGDGTFAPEVTYAAGASPGTVVLSDFNGDGALDIASSGTELDVLLNRGDGTFAPPINDGTAIQASSGLVVGDFNGDGVADLASTDSDWTGGQDVVQMLVGVGDGTFEPLVTYEICSPTSNTDYGIGGVADFNHDGLSDLVLLTGCESTPSIRIMHAQCE